MYPVQCVTHKTHMHTRARTLLEDLGDVRGLDALAVVLERLHALCWSFVGCVSVGMYVWVGG